MNNWEWLKSLEPAELSAWFEAEHGAPGATECQPMRDLMGECDEYERIVDRLQRENMQLASDLGECMAERDELRAAYDALVAIAADLCRACGFSMVDAGGEVV